MKKQKWRSQMTQSLSTLTDMYSSSDIGSYENELDKCGVDPMYRQLLSEKEQLQSDLTKSQSEVKHMSMLASQLTEQVRLDQQDPMGAMLHAKNARLERQL